MVLPSHLQTSQHTHVQGKEQRVTPTASPHVTCVRHTRLISHVGSMSPQGRPPCLVRCLCRTQITGPLATGRRRGDGKGSPARLLLAWTFSDVRLLWLPARLQGARLNGPPRALAACSVCPRRACSAGAGEGSTRGQQLPKSPRAFLSISRGGVGAGL